MHPGLEKESMMSRYSNQLAPLDLGIGPLRDCIPYMLPGTPVLKGNIA